MAGGDSLGAAWSAAFGSARPVTYLLRQELPRRWVRIHSLPDGRRYPRSRGDREELLARHNEVATALLGAGETSQCIASVSGESLARAWPGQREEVPGRFLRFATVRLEPDPADGRPSASWRCYAREVTWTRGGFDRLILAVAADDPWPKRMFANLARGTIYAPYDGGADLVLADPAAAAAARRTWRHWLPPRADGL